VFEGLVVRTEAMKEVLVLKTWKRLDSWMILVDMASVSVVEVVLVALESSRAFSSVRMCSRAAMLSI